MNGSKFSYTAQLKQLKKSLTLDKDYIHAQIEKAVEGCWKGLHFDEVNSMRYEKQKELNKNNKGVSSISDFDVTHSAINPNNEPYPNVNDREAIIAWNKRRIAEYRSIGEEVEIIDDLFNFGLKFC